MKTPSGFRQRLIEPNSPGRSFTQCRLKLETTKSTELSLNYTKKTPNTKHLKFKNIINLNCANNYIQRFLVHFVSSDLQTRCPFGLRQHCGTHFAQMQMLDCLGENVLRDESSIAAQIDGHREFTLHVEQTIGQSETHFVLNVVEQRNVGALVGDEVRTKCRKIMNNLNILIAHIITV